MKEQKCSYTRRLIGTDLQRFSHHTDILGRFRVFHHIYFSFIMTFWYRIGHYLLQCNHPVLNAVAMSLVRLIHKKNSYRLGIQLPLNLTAGEDLLFGHYLCIVLNGHAVIVNRATISQGCTIGNNFIKGPRAPVIGDNCVLGLGRKVCGRSKHGEILL